MCESRNMYIVRAAARHRGDPVGRYVVLAHSASRGQFLSCKAGKFQKMFVFRERISFEIVWQTMKLLCEGLYFRVLRCVDVWEGPLMCQLDPMNVISVAAQNTFKIFSLDLIASNL